MEQEKICKCGHPKERHAFDGTGECYTFKHLKGCHYQCVCRRFEGNGTKENGTKEIANKGE